MRIKKKEKHSCELYGLMWLVRLTMKFGSMLLGRQGQMGCVVNHTCGSKSLLLCTFSRTVAYSCSLPASFEGRKNHSWENEKEVHTSVWNANSSACLLTIPLPTVTWLRGLGRQWTLALLDSAVQAVPAFPAQLPSTVSSCLVPGHETRSSVLFGSAC